MTSPPISIPLSGATRLYFIIGDPIAQVKSPAGVTRSLLRRGLDAIMMPVQIAPRNLGDFIATATAIGNLDGLVVTVPHKFECFRHCASATGRASLLGSVNVMRRAASGWFGDIVDGLGFVGAARRHGRDPRGERAF
jgi:shikimate 5-dehydrogenase